MQQQFGSELEALAQAIPERAAISMVLLGAVAAGAVLRKTGGR